MDDRPPLSKGETEVLKAAWSIRSGSVGEIFEAVPKRRAFEYSTVQTYIRRLISKGYLEEVRRVGRNRIYQPTVRKRTVVRQAVNEFVDRIFDGEMLPMMRHLIKDRRVSSEEIQQLRQLLDETEGAIGDSER